MTEEKKKNKSGAGKFFLGALIGAAASAVAGHFMKKSCDEECEKDCKCGDNCECGDKCECEKDCKCDKKDKVEKKKTAEKK